MNDDCDEFFKAVGYVATIVTIALLGGFVGCELGKTPNIHHTSYRDARGEITCEICKDLLEKGKTNEHK